MLIAILSPDNHRLDIQAFFSEDDFSDVGGIEVCDPHLQRIEDFGANYGAIEELGEMHTAAPWGLSIVRDQDGYTYTLIN